MLSSGPDRCSPHVGHRSGTAPHAHLCAAARMYPPLTRHSPGVSLLHPPQPTILVVNCQKSCRLQSFYTGFAGRGGRLDLVISAVPASGNIFRPTGLMVSVFILGKGVFWSKLWSTPPTSYQGRRGLLFASLIWACSNKTWMSNTSRKVNSVLRALSLSSCQCFMLISTNIRPVCLCSIIWSGVIPSGPVSIC